MAQGTLNLSDGASLLESFEHSQKDLKSGITLLASLLADRSIPPEKIYGRWLKTLHETGDIESSRVKWVWQTLRTDSRLRDNPELNDSVFSFQNVGVFHDGTWLVLVVKPNSKTKHQPLILKHRPPVLIQLHKQLVFRSGKAGNMECCDCVCTVYVPVTEQLNVDSQAELLSVPSDDVCYESYNDAPILTIKAKSINQAYTLASRKLEPKRRSHGGRAFDRVWYLQNGTPLSLLQIRLNAEHGLWKMPKKADNPPSNYETAMAVFV